MSTPAPPARRPSPTTQRFCPACGTSLDVADEPDRHGARGRSSRGRDSPSPPRGAPRRARPARSGPAGARPGERFAPGTVLGGRYRIVGLLGRGGMGEVYRADDLKLEQPVALKFLPRALEGDAERLERLYGEVRMARQVSHPAVCRVWDVGEAEGQHFLSMEFVDGENLASLLRRIGRLPQDKALDIARQVGGRLAAAHEKGVLHRDLKPANVMLDGQGKVRLTDFGLAGLAEALSGDDVRSGTPVLHVARAAAGARGHRPQRHLRARPPDLRALHRAPRLRGQGARRARRASTATSGRSSRRRSSPTSTPRSSGRSSPASRRTRSAGRPRRSSSPRCSPGRDPLEAAIAAGETPSPELVAAAGESEGLRPRRGLGVPRSSSCWAPCSCPRRRSRRQLLARIPVEKSPAALEDRARELAGAARARGGRPPTARSGFSQRRRLLPLGPGSRTAPPTRWDVARARAIRRSCTFWYRQSPRPARAVLAERRRGLERPAGARRRAWRASSTTSRAGCVAFYAVPPAARAASAGRARGARLGAALRRGAARPVEVPPGRAAVDAALLLRRARGLGGHLAAAARDRPPRRGRRLPRPARLVRDREPLDAPRARAAVPAHRGPAGGCRRSYVLVLVALVGDRRRSSPTATSASAAATGAAPSAWPSCSRLWPWPPGPCGAHHVRRPGGRARPVRAGRGHRGPGGGAALALLPRPRALRAPAAARGRSSPGRACSRAGRATRWWAATSSSAWPWGTVLALLGVLARALVVLARAAGAAARRRRDRRARSRRACS